MISKNGRCPMCGNFGKNLGEGVFHCHLCGITFDTFFVFSEREINMNIN